MQKKKQMSITREALTIVTVLLAVGISLMGVVLVSQSRAAMKAQIDARMLDIANTAADMMNGDSLAALTAEDADTQPYQDALASLKVFQDNIDLDYIYGIRQVGEKDFIFTVDPAPVDPGAFGDPIEYTEALGRAAAGTPAVDKEPYSDRWGRFYSAYSPVFDSEGKVAGIVAVDFSASWVEDQVGQQTLAIVITSVLVLLVGAVVVLVVTSRIRERFRSLNYAMNGLTEDMEALAKALKLPAAGADRAGEAKPADEIDELSRRIRDTRQEIRGYFENVQGKE